MSKISNYWYPLSAAMTRSVQGTVSRWAGILLVAVAITGCAFCQKGALPDVSLPLLGSRAPKPSLVYAVSFLPPDADEKRTAALHEEFVQQLTESKLFAELRPQPSEAEVTLSLELIEVNLSMGSTVMTYLSTGGLWPVSVPYRYELNATARRATGVSREYSMADESYCRVWCPGLLMHALGDLVDPRSSEIRKNLYRTLLRRMVDDGLL